MGPTGGGVISREIMRPRAQAASWGRKKGSRARDILGPYCRRRRIPIKKYLARGWDNKPTAAALFPEFGLMAREKNFEKKRAERALF
jgi:hypothetical protein